jgi:hypothetical protein
MCNETRKMPTETPHAQDGALYFFLHFQDCAKQSAGVDELTKSKLGALQDSVLSGRMAPSADDDENDMKIEMIRFRCHAVIECV